MDILLAIRNIYFFFRFELLFGLPDVLLVQKNTFGYRLLVSSMITGDKRSKTDFKIFAGYQTITTTMSNMPFY